MQRCLIGNRRDRQQPQQPRHKNNADRTRRAQDMTKTRDSGLTEAFDGVSTSATLFSQVVRAIRMMRAVGEGREEGRVTRSKSNVPEDYYLLALPDMRDQTRLPQINQGQIEKRHCPLAARPFWQLALVAGNSVQAQGTQPGTDSTQRETSRSKTLLTNFLILCIGLGRQPLARLRPAGGWHQALALPQGK